MEELKILQIAPRFPFPLDDGGKIGIANIYREFHFQGAKVTLVSLGDEVISKTALIESQHYGEAILYRHNTQNTPLRILKSVVFNHSIYLDKHYSKSILKNICDLCEENRFDVIHADHTCMARLALNLRSKFHIPCGLRLHNIEWMIWKRYADELSKYSAKRMYINHQAELLKDEEKKIISEMDVNFAITEEDKRRAVALSPNAHVVVASAGVDTNEWKPDSNIERNPKEMIIASTFHWIHNVNALEWFIREVLPIIQNEIPEATLTVIGKNIPERLTHIRSNNVNFVGYVDKVQPYYNRASINIAPLFVGSGIRIKILEAMAMELPVVASPIAAEGIKAQPSDGLFLAESKDKFANNIINLCKDPENVSIVGKAARKYIIDGYSWKKNVALMLDEYRKLI